MKRIVEMAGDLIGIVGILLCLGSGIGRLAGSFLWIGYEMGTIFLMGVGLMVVGCLAQLYVIRKELRLNEQVRGR